MSYSPEKLYAVLSALPSARRIWVAYSGGCDSQVLLQSLVKLNLADLELRAIHVDHGLQTPSADWARQCVAWASALGVECHVVRVDAKAQAGESPEAAARNARYRALVSVMEQGDVLLTAHHADDQAETLLLQLLRGSGAAGLAAMAGATPFAKGWLCRPLLEFTRAQLEDYARAQNLAWIDDPSNAAVTYDRNFLRHQVTPGLAQRWPSWQKVLGRAAALQAESAKLADDLAAADLQVAQGSGPANLNIERVLALADYRQRNLLRFWLKGLGFNPPTSHQMREIQSSLLNVGEDRNPKVLWNGVELRRYRNQIYAMRPLAVHDSRWQGRWDARTHATFDTPIVRLDIEHLLAQQMPLEDIVRTPFDVCFRQGGEKIRLKGQRIHHDLKNLFQQAAVPPWERDRVPLLFRDGRMIAVYGYWLGEAG